MTLLFHLKKLVGAVLVVLLQVLSLGVQSLVEFFELANCGFLVFLGTQELLQLGDFAVYEQIFFRQFLYDFVFGFDVLAQSLVARVCASLLLKKFLKPRICCRLLFLRLER